MAPARPEAAPLNGPLPTRAKVSLVAEVLAAYPRARFAARRDDIRLTMRRLRQTEGDVAAPADPERLGRAIRLGRAVTRTLKPLPVDSRCLTQSLVLTHLLARRGIDTKLVIGVKPGKDFAAHAWVELEGQPLLPTGEGEFERIVDL
jgi:hypothetical protein